MAYKIIFKKRFTNKLVKVLAYLEQEWSQQVAAAFLKKQITGFSNYKSNHLQVFLLRK